MTLNIFDTKDAKSVRDQLVEFLSEEEKRGYVEVTRNDEITERWGVEGAVLEAKISKGKRCNFHLHYGGFMLVGKTVSLSHNILDVGGSVVFLNEFDLKGLDCISLEVAY